MSTRVSAFVRHLQLRTRSRSHQRAAMDGRIHVCSARVVWCRASLLASQRLSWNRTTRHHGYLDSNPRTEKRNG